MNTADAALIDEFIDALWLADGLSKNTLGSYRSDLSLFADWLEGEFGSSPCAPGTPLRGAAIVGAGETAINAYLAHLNARPCGIQ